MWLWSSHHNEPMGLVYKGIWGGGVLNSRGMWDFWAKKANKKANFAIAMAACNGAALFVSGVANTADSATGDAIWGRNVYNGVYNI